MTRRRFREPSTKTGVTRWAGLAALACALMIPAGGVLAADIELRNGHRLVGDLRSLNDTEVVIELRAEDGTSGGLLTLARADIRPRSLYGLLESTTEESGASRFELGEECLALDLLDEAEDEFRLAANRDPEIREKALAKVGLIRAVRAQRTYDAAKDLLAEGRHVEARIRLDRFVREHADSYLAERAAMAIRALDGLEILEGAGASAMAREEALDPVLVKAAARARTYRAHADALEADAMLARGDVDAAIARLVRASRALDRAVRVLRSVGSRRLSPTSLALYEEQIAQTEERLVRVYVRIARLCLADDKPDRARRFAERALTVAPDEDAVLDLVADVEARLREDDPDVCVGGSRLDRYRRDPRGVAPVPAPGGRAVNPGAPHRGADPRPPSPAPRAQPVPPPVRPGGRGR